MLGIFLISGQYKSQQEAADLAGMTCSLPAEALKCVNTSQCLRDLHMAEARWVGTMLGFSYEALTVLPED